MIHAVTYQFDSFCGSFLRAFTSHALRSVKTVRLITALGRNMLNLAIRVIWDKWNVSFD